MSPDMLCIKTFITKKSEGESEQVAISVKCQLPAFLTIARLSDSMGYIVNKFEHVRGVQWGPGWTNLNVWDGGEVPLQ